ncbi:MAG: DUF192 domain-containing protein [Anaeromyxobacteraceae bacterium]
MTSRRAAAIVGLAVAALGCRAPSPSPGPPDARASRPRVTLESPSGRSSAVDVEVAHTPAEVERGLMFRRELAPDAGMIFVFDQESEHVFWMKNTFIPLDMIFIADGGAVVGVVENAEPQTTTPRTVYKKSRYVLEVSGGWSAAHGVKPGDLARFENISTGSQ